MTTMCLQDLHSSEKVIAFRRPTQVTDEQRIEVAVRNRIRFSSATKISQAVHRALNLFNSGRQMDDAISTACKWALSTVDEGTPPPGAA